MREVRNDNVQNAWTIYTIYNHATKSAIPTKKTTKTILVLACLNKKTQYENTTKNSVKMPKKGQKKNPSRNGSAKVETFY